MARTADQIITALSASISSSDITLDVVTGPIPDLYIRPQAGELAVTEEAAEDLRTLFTLQFPSVITTEETRQALLNYGSTPGEGRSARHTQYFLRFTRPVEDIAIPAGAIVSNSAGTLTYRVLTPQIMLASAADTYFNPARNAYEIATLVEATGTGTDYNLPPYRVNTLITPIVGIDTTENRIRSSGGKGPETATSQTNRLKTSLLGINLGAPGGIKSRILDTFSDRVTDVQVVQPYEPEFTRPVIKPALDLYIIGTSLNTTTETFTAMAGQTEYTFLNKPVNQIFSVTINGTPYSNYTLLNDDSEAYGRSISAQDRIIFDMPLLPGDLVVIQLEFDEVLKDIKDGLLGEDQGNLFNTDFLLRLMVPIYPKIKMDLKVLPSYSAPDVQAAISGYLQTKFSPDLWTSIIYPEIVRQEILNSIPGIQTLRTIEFKRSSGALADIEPLQFNRRELVTYDPNLILINVAV